MKIGFYAPLKSPHHTVPSGDRKMARLLIKTLKACGHHVEILSELRSWEGDGSCQAQQEIHDRAQQEVERLVQKYRTVQAPDVIFTYHIYHKAPDWIGVTLAGKLQVPYIIAEASTASKQIDGPWHSGYEQSMKCIQQAQSIIAFNPVDVECLEPLLKPSQSMQLVKPYLDETFLPIGDAAVVRENFADQYNLDPKKVWLTTVAMMRHGDKSASYKILAESLKQLNSESWQLLVIGDGAAFDQVKRYFNDIDSQCFFAGMLDQHSIWKWLAVSDIFVWPAVNEAYGFAIMESLAAGLPAVVQNYGGVSTIVEHKRTGYVTDPASPEQFQQALASLIDDSGKRNSMGIEARKKFLSSHSFTSAIPIIDSIFKKVINTG